jgi:guanine nucleotide-binding protein subunit beta-2-like 1 protein
MTTRQIFTGHTKDVLSVAFSQDNRMILSGGMDKTLRFWNTKGENKYISTNFQGWVSSMCHIRQGKDSLLAVGSWDSKVRIFDSELTFNRGIDAQDYAVVSMNSDDEGEYLFVGQKNGSVKIWNMANDQTESDTLKQTFDVNADLNALSYESKYFTVITLATSKGISVRDIKGQTELYSRSYGNKGKEGKDDDVVAGCLSLAWDATKTYLFAGFTDGVIRVYKFGYEN